VAGFNNDRVRGRGRAPQVVSQVVGSIHTAPRPALQNPQGLPAFKRSPQGELFVLGVSLFFGEKTFYEGADSRGARFVSLVQTVVQEDPRWVSDFLGWLRVGGNIRTASLVGAIEAGLAWPRCVVVIPASRVYTGRPGSSPRREVPCGRTALYRLSDGHLVCHECSVNARDRRAVPVGSPRDLLVSVLKRSDEPGEALAYWDVTYPGRKHPKWFTRALGAAILRLYDERAVLRPGALTGPVSLWDVIEVSQVPRRSWVSYDQEILFRYILDLRRGASSVPVPPELEKIRRFREIQAIPESRRLDFLGRVDAVARLEAGGFTWRHLSGWVPGGMNASAWSVAAHLMGATELIMNLRNLESARVGRATRDWVANYLRSPGVIRKSRILPIQILMAYLAVSSDHWRAVLDDVMEDALESVPALSGRTLILIDTSLSMRDKVSEHSSAQRWDVAALFGLAQARQCESADVVSFSYNPNDPDWSSRVFPLQAGENVLASVARFRAGYLLNSGTDIEGAVRRHFAGHDRVILITDEVRSTAYRGVFDRVPETVPTYTFNMAGYEAAATASGPNRHAVASLSDAGFKMIGVLDAAVSGPLSTWPWELADFQPRDSSSALFD
jgi:hypothetical protein